MSILHKPWLKATTLSLFTVLIFIAAPVATRADPVTFEATTAGCFGVGCTGFDLTPSGLGLTFSSSTITPATSDSSGSLALNDLGSFTLNTVPDSGAFTLQINFTQPAGLHVGQSVMITATIDRVLDSNLLPTNTVDIRFNNPLTLFFFTQPGVVVGSFQLTISDLSVGLGQTVTLRGDITNAGQGPDFGSQVPEPATLGLLATGLSGLIGIARRRRKRAHSAE